jgi:hypothetical protein
VELSRFEDISISFLSPSLPEEEKNGYTAKKKEGAQRDGDADDDGSFLFLLSETRC